MESECQAPGSTSVPAPPDVRLWAVPLGLSGLAIVLAWPHGNPPQGWILFVLTALLMLGVALSARLRGNEVRRLFLRDALVLVSVTGLVAVLVQPLPGWTCVVAALLLGVSFVRLLEDFVRLPDQTRRAAQFLGSWLPVTAFVVGSLAVFLHTPVELAADSGSYVSAAREPLASPILWGGARAPLFPLAIKLFANPPDFEGLVWFQFLLGTAAWVTLAVVVSRSMTRPWLGALATLVILRIGAGCDLLFWHKQVLSESLSLSFQTLVLAALGHAITRGLQPTPSRGRQIALAGLVLGPATPWALVRDTNAYLLLGAAGLIGGLLATRRTTRDREVWFWATLATGFITLFVAANASSNLGRRWQFPFVNVLGQRILPYPGLTAEFAARGMPTGENALRFRGKWASDWDSDWSGFQPWLDERAKREYTRWLLGRPVRSLLEPLLDWQSLSASTTFYSQRRAAPAWQAAWQPVFELPSSEFLGAMATTLALMALATRRRGLCWQTVFPATLLLLVYPGAFTAWHGDAMEMARHALGTMVLARVAIWIGILFALDVLLGARPGDETPARDTPT